MTSDLPTSANVPDLDAIAEKWLRLCGACDAGIGSCVCPPGDPRNVIDSLVDEARRLRAELSQVQKERDEARRDLAETRQRLWGLANAAEALAARMHAADPLNKRTDRVWARELREAIAAAAAETAPETGASDPDVVEVWKERAYAENERRYAAEHRHDEARAALAALRAEVGNIADERAAQAKRLGPLTDETSGPDRVAWLICDEDATRLHALVTSTQPPVVNAAGVKSH